jgi:Ca2+-binding RTX toxin-like protein
MATSFKLFYLGTAAAIDTVEGNVTSENHNALNNLTFGSAGNTVAQNVGTLNPDGLWNYSGGNSVSYDANNLLYNEGFHIDGGGLQTFDALMLYSNSTITYTDGSTATGLTAIVMQDTAVKLYLLPPPSGSTGFGAYTSALEAKPILSITLGIAAPVNGNETYGMTADRYVLNLHDYVVEGTSGNDYIGAAYNGDAEGDRIDGTDNLAGNNNDSVTAGSGNDTVVAGLGNDTVRGEQGNDLLLGQSGNDSLDGGDGHDTLVGGTGSDVLNGGLGVDFADYADSSAGVSIDLSSTNVVASGGDAAGDSGQGIDGVIGSAFNDTLVGYDGMGTAPDDLYTNIFDGGAGNDTIDGRGGDDSLFGGVGNDTIEGGSGNDLIYGDGMSTAFNPVAHLSTSGGAATSFTFVNSGEATVSLYWIDNAGQLVFYDTVASGESYVQPTYGGHNWVAYDTATNKPAMYLGNPANGATITLVDGNDSITAGSGNDTIFAGGGDDTVFGGSGNDSVSLGSGDDIYGDWATSDYGNDTVDGGAGDDSINGREGNDLLLGGSGNDYLTGGIGIDTLDGGADIDLFGVTDDHGTGTIIGGEAGIDYDMIAFSNFTTAQGVNVVFSGNEAGTYSFFDPAATASGSFTQIEDIADTAYNDFIDARLSGSAQNLFATTGNDTVYGGSGDDFISGGAGVNYLEGGAGNDVFQSYGTDTIVGGSGYDVIDQSIVTASFNVSSFSGIEEIRASDTGDSWYWVSDSVLYVGGDGGDTVSAGSGQDTLQGVTGNDSFSGGAGNDSIVGGIGNDTLIAGDGSDTVLGGDDADYIKAGPGDFVDGGEGGTDSDTLDLTGSEPAGGSLNIVFDSGNSEAGTVYYRDASGTVVNTLTFTNIELVVPCFTENTLIKTPRGEVRATDLQPGDLVHTRDNGMQAVRWVGRRTLSAQDLREVPHLRPVTIQAGALGANMPERALTVSPQHRMLIASVRTQLWFGEEEVLAAAINLVGMPGIERTEVDEVTYVHIMFDHHQIICGDGAWSESFQPGDQSLRGFDEAQRAELAELFPQLVYFGGRRRYLAARPTLKAHEARLLAG